MSHAQELQAAQLIYTNVEADQSPTRQRGFQIWQWSPELSPDQRRLIAKRVDDFRLPPGAGPADAETVRYLYCRPAGNLNVIARTVGLADRDKFGRGGKFFAHALLLADEDMSKISFDPFSVIDGSFQFANHPNEIKDRNPTWLKGELPRTQVQSALPSADRTEIDRECLLNLIYHLECNDDRPIVLPQKPTVVLRVLRELYSLLPTNLRKRLTFDTLSNGSTLQQARYSFVGAYSPSALNLWSFRRYVKMDLEKREFIPRLERKGTSLPQSLITEPFWLRLPLLDQDRLYEEVQKLVEKRLSDLNPELTKAVYQEMESHQEIMKAVGEAINERISRDVPAQLLSLPKVKANVGMVFAGSVSEILPSLLRQVPGEVVDEGLASELEARADEALEDSLIQALQQRGCNSSNEKLRWMKKRWCGTWDEVEEVAAELQEPANAGSWLDQWVDSSLPAGLRGDGGLEELVSRLESCQFDRDLDIRNAQLVLGRKPEPVSYEWVKGKLLLALVAGVQRFSSVYEGFRSADPLTSGWAREWAIQRLAQTFKEQAVWGWSIRNNHALMGLFVSFDLKHELEQTLLRAEGLAYGDSTEYCTSVKASKLFGECWPEDIPFTARSEMTATSSPQLDKCYNNLLKAEQGSYRKVTEALIRELTKTDHEGFRAIANRMLEKLTAVKASTIQDSEGSEGRQIGFVGLKLESRDSIPPKYLWDLLAAVFGAVVPQLNLSDRLCTQGNLQRGRFDRRWSWLATRLLHPNSTTNLKIS
jgi:hypothetical protein